MKYFSDPAPKYDAAVTKMPCKFSWRRYNAIIPKIN